MSYVFSTGIIWFFLAVGTFVHCVRNPGDPGHLSQAEDKVKSRLLALAWCCILPYSFACFLVTFDYAPEVHFLQWALATILHLPGVIAYLEFLRAIDKNCEIWKALTN